MRLLLALVPCALLLAASAAAADDFDGKHGLVCAPTAAAECDTSAACDTVDRDEIDLPKSLHVDFKAKLIRSADGKRSSPIRSVDVSEAALIVQGSQYGRGWSMVVARATGQMTGTIAEAAGAFVLAGTCSVVEAPAPAAAP